MLDIIIVGAGPAGLAAGIRLKQLNPDLNVAILEKASTIGGHLISGAILQKDAYMKYIKKYSLKSDTKIIKENIWQLNSKNYFDLSKFVPKNYKNEGNILVNINEICMSMAKDASNLGVDIYTCCGVRDIITNSNSTIGVLLSDNTKLLSKYTIIAEGACGLLTTKLLKFYKKTLNKDFALGIREEWKPVSKDLIGSIYHTIGYPLNNKTNWGGGFIYNYNDNITIGYITHLNYENSHLCPYNEFERFKNHPYIKNILSEAKKTKYGAKIISTNSIGLPSDGCYPGCTIIGCAFGLVDTVKLKGLHNAFNSGEKAAENYVRMNCKLVSNKAQEWLNPVLDNNLSISRNESIVLRKYGPIILVLYKLISKLFLWYQLIPSIKIMSINNISPPRYWNITDNRIETLVFSGLNYIGGKNHIDINNKLLHKIYDLKLYDKLSNSFCPAKVYSWKRNLKHYEFKANYENCIQCKTCIVKTANSTINWNICTNGNGPNYL
ncbi:MAG: 4Fe-4S dicluster domain-containing protein [Candidatus Hodgkinia cicadicola]